MIRCIASFFCLAGLVSCKPIVSYTETKTYIFHSDLIAERPSPQDETLVFDLIREWAQNEGYTNISARGDLRSQINWTSNQEDFSTVYRKVMDSSRPKSSSYLTVLDGDGILIITLTSFLDGTKTDRTRQKPILDAEHKMFEESVVGKVDMKWQPYQQ